MMQLKISTRVWLFIVLIIFGSILCLISLVNHYTFNTSALDLGVYTHAMHYYSHFEFYDSSMYKAQAENQLSDHFDLILIILSPLVLVLKSYTLLIVQIVFLLIGAYGCFKFISERFNSDLLGLFSCIYFLTFFGVYTAASFDYHSNVIAACLIPWLIIYLHRDQFVVSGLLFLLILVAKENMALWAFFVCVGLLIEYRRDKKKRVFLFSSAAFALVYFLLVVKLIMPVLSNEGVYPHFNYSVLGNNMSEAFFSLITHPFESVQILFQNHMGIEHGDGVKANFHLMMLISGVFLLLARPQYIIMIVPIYFQKLFHDNYNMWGMFGQYSIEFAPILAIGIFDVIGRVPEKFRLGLILLIFAANIGATVRTMDVPPSSIKRSQIRFYQIEHYYNQELDVEGIYNALNRIPSDAAVSAMSNFAPHLALRDKSYQFPIIKDAEYIIYARTGNGYPLEYSEFLLKIDSLENSNYWEEMLEVKNFKILKRR